MFLNNKASDKKLLNIYQMAKIHEISWQTLIYYDRIELFSPYYTSEIGDRYYDALQIPLLKEICFLKSIGIKLEDIKPHITSSKNTKELLDLQLNKLDTKINALNEQISLIRQRLEIYKEANEYPCNDYNPTIEYFPERKAICVPWTNENVDKQVLHETLTKLWKIVLTHDISPKMIWGAVVFKDYINTLNPLYKSGLCTFIPLNADVEGSTVFPAGNYVCMQNIGLPCELNHLERLLHWIDEHNYKIIGNIFDECIDSIKQDSEVNIYQLQIPIAPI